jgi:hypothetical protein
MAQLMEGPAGLLHVAISKRLGIYYRDYQIPRKFSLCLGRESEFQVSRLDSSSSARIAGSHSASKAFGVHPS